MAEKRPRVRRTATPVTRSERSRSLLIQAASEALIAGNGTFESQELAKRAGVSVGLAYHHFGSKSGLIVATVEHFYDQLALAIHLDDFVATDWEVRERERLSRLIDFLYSHKMAGVIIGALARDPEVAAIEAARWSALIDTAARNIRKGQARGQIPASHRPAILAALICGGVRHAVGQALAGRSRPAKTRLAADIWRFISGGLQLQGAVNSPSPARDARHSTATGVTTA